MTGEGNDDRPPHAPDPGDDIWTPSPRPGREADVPAAHVGDLDDIWTSDADEDPAGSGPGPGPDAASSSDAAASPGPDDDWAPRLASEDERAARKAERKAQRAARAEEAAAKQPSGVRGEFGWILELAAMTGFAVTLPVLGSFGESPETFVGAGADRNDIIVFALWASIVPLVIVSVIAVASRIFGPQVRRSVQVGLIGILGAMGAVPLARNAGWSNVGRWLAALVVGVGLAAAYRRWAPVGTFLRCAAATSAILVATFLFGSPVSTLVNPPKVEPPKVAAQSGDHPDVVVVVFDELPTLSLVDGKGQIDAERFPNFARLAKTSTWFRNSTTVAPETLLAVPALATGKMPIDSTNVPLANYEEYPDSVFSLLGPTYDVHAVEWATDLCSPKFCSGDDPELDATSRKLIEADIAEPDPAGALVEAGRRAWLQQIDPRKDVAEKSLAFPGADDSVQLAEPGLRWLSGLQSSDGDAPTFDWLDVGLPHQPWRLLPSGNQHNGPDAPPGSALLGWSDNPSGVEHGLAARTTHLLQLQWADRYLGTVLDRLEDQGRLDDSAVIVTADHGVSFTPGPMRDLDPKNTDQIGYAPLFVKAPGQDAGAVDDGNVSSLDILPTIADYANVDIPWQVDGLSLADGAPRTDPTKVMVAIDASRFPNRAFDDVVFIAPTGLDAIKASPFVTDRSPAGQGAGDLNVYRHGRHGDLIGKRVADLTTCRGGPKVDYEPPKGWEAWTSGSFDPNDGKVPLFHHGTLDTKADTDVAVAVDGVIAGWATSRANEEGNPFDVLLAEPLTQGTKGAVELYEIRPASSTCLLHQLTR